MVIKLLIVVVLCFGELKTQDMCKQFEAKSGFSFDKALGLNIIQSIIIHSSGASSPQSPDQCLTMDFTRNDTGTYLGSNGDTSKMTFQDENKGYATFQKPFFSTVMNISATWLNFGAGDNYEYQVIVECIPMLGQSYYYIVILHPKGKDIDDSTMKNILDTIKQQTGFEDSASNVQGPSCGKN